MKKIIWYYLSYPLRLLYKNRISIYKNTLFKLKIYNSNTFIKSRRTGSTNHNIENLFFDIYCITYMENFINKWSLK